MHRFILAYSVLVSELIAINIGLDAIMIAILGSFEFYRTAAVHYGIMAGPPQMMSGRGSRVVKVSDRGWSCHVTSSSPVPLKTRRVGR
ncbi:hypothetical protein TNCV_518101 [Trichonephila clavipes]|nr:hypothetical protein TNCV_518101 [Trichonephila clavipes]